jgi:hypothetical protein
MRLAVWLRSTTSAVVVGGLAIGCSAAPAVVPTAPPVSAPTAVPPTAVSVPTAPLPTSVPPTAVPTPEATAPAPTSVPPTALPTPETTAPPVVAPTQPPILPTATASAAQAQFRGPDQATAIALLAVQFESALNRGDVDAAMAMFEERAEVKIPPDVYVGEAQIRGWLEYLAANQFSAEPGFRRVTGDRITWSLAVRSDHLNRLGLPSLDGAATLVEHEGKIASYTFVLSRESAARHRAAQLAASQVLQDPVIVGLTSANVYGFSDVFRDSTGKLISYRDVLTSEPGTGPFYDLWGEPIIVRSGF